MPVFRLPEDDPWLPDPNLAEPNGLLAVGGDLSPQRLLAAYEKGIFPWYSEGEPILWWSPDPRFVLLPSELHVGRSLRKAIRRARFEIRFDTAFSDVIRGCARVRRPGQDGTWITGEMVAAYERLHRLGVAHSIEAFDGGRLVGGLYGVALGRVFFGESMFSRVSNASKAAFVEGMAWMVSHGLALVDCQLHTGHLERFGARFVGRRAFLAILQDAVRAPGLPTGSWRRKQRTTAARADGALRGQPFARSGRTQGTEAGGACDCGRAEDILKGCGGKHHERG